jgi:hypothetical protein
MCMFCAAIPVTLALGAKAHSIQHRQQQSEAVGVEPAGKPQISAGAATAVALVGLVAASIVVHSQQGS